MYLVTNLQVKETPGKLENCITEARQTPTKYMKSALTKELELEHFDRPMENLSG